MLIDNHQKVISRNDSRQNDVKLTGINDGETQYIDPQHKDTKLNGTLHNDTQHNDTQSEDSQHNDTQHINTKPFDTKRYETQQKDTYHNGTYNSNGITVSLHVIMPRGIMVCVFLLSVVAPT
jgi:hypothetical protein